MWMVLQQIADGAAEGAGAVAVDDPNVLKTIEECLVEKLVCFVNGFVGRSANNVTLRYEEECAVLFEHICES